MRTLLLALRIGTLALIISATAACDNPCVQLGHAICDCEATETAQQTCRSAVDDRADETDLSSADEKRCSELLEDCSCERLAAGDLAACGLSEP